MQEASGNVNSLAHPTPTERLTSRLPSPGAFFISRRTHLPRTGGVYAPPAGTKGTPNTTIQSSKYNTFVDDLTADANAARPITAGGTGATSASGARTALGLEIGTNVQAYDADLTALAAITIAADQLAYGTGAATWGVTSFSAFTRTYIDDADAATFRATTGTNNATNLTTGTVADARLPATQAGKTFTGTSGFFPATGTAASILMDGANGFIELYNTSGPGIDFKNASGDDYDARIQLSGGNTLNFSTTANLLHNGNIIWTSGNDGAGSGLDADLIDGFGTAQTTGVANTVAVRRSDGYLMAAGLIADGAANSASMYWGSNLTHYIQYDGSNWVVGGSGDFFIANALNFLGSGAATTRTNLGIKTFSSSNQTITLGGLLTLAHSLGVAPTSWEIYAVCTTTEGNWAVNDVVRLTGGADHIGSATSYGTAIYADATNVYVRTGVTGFQALIINKTTGVIFAPTAANWAYRVVARTPL